jgi:hypothetical protein
MGEIRDRAIAIAALVEAFGVKLVDFTPVRTKAYENGLQDIPIPLLNAAVRRAIQTRTWFPKVAELRADAEMCRREMLEAHPYERCSACNYIGTVQIGYTELPSGHRKPRYGRCACWTRHQALLEGLGATEKPIVHLPGATEQPESDLEPPTVDALPPAISDRVRQLSEAKKF